MVCKRVLRRTTAEGLSQPLTCRNLQEITERCTQLFRFQQMAAFCVTRIEPLSGGTGQPPLAHSIIYPSNQRMPLLGPKLKGEPLFPQRIA